jgi:hypothetical protein
MSAAPIHLSTCSGDRAPQIAAVTPSLDNVHATAAAAVWTSRHRRRDPVGGRVRGSRRCVRDASRWPGARAIGRDRRCRRASRWPGASRRSRWFRAPRAPRDDIEESLLQASTCLIPFPFDLESKGVIHAARLPRATSANSAEDAHAAWPYQEADDDENDAVQDRTADQCDDSQDDEDRRDDPQDGCDPASTIACSDDDVQWVLPSVAVDRGLPGGDDRNPGRAALSEEVTRRRS